MRGNIKIDSRNLGKIHFGDRHLDFNSFLSIYFLVGGIKKFLRHFYDHLEERFTEKLIKCRGLILS